MKNYDEAGTPEIAALWRSNEWAGIGGELFPPIPLAIVRAATGANSARTATTEFADFNPMLFDRRGKLLHGARSPSDDVHTGEQS